MAQSFAALIFRVGLKANLLTHGVQIGVVAHVHGLGGRGHDLGAGGVPEQQLVAGVDAVAVLDVAGADEAARLGLHPAAILTSDRARAQGPEFEALYWRAAEALLGAVLAEAPELRAQFVLATKGGIEMGVPYNSSGAYILSAVEASLRRLKVEQIDLWQIHRPDHLAHPAEIARAFETLLSQGKVRA
jgi:hypothetical protein